MRSGRSLGIFAVTCYVLIDIFDIKCNTELRVLSYRKFVVGFNENKEPCLVLAKDFSSVLTIIKSFLATIA